MTYMLKCPDCRTRINRVRTSKGSIYVCPKCTGRAIPFSVFKDDAPAAFLTRLWQSAYVGPDRKGGRPCPMCENKMTEIEYPVGRGQLIGLGVCTHCRCVWFEPKEYLAHQPPAMKLPPPPPAAKPGAPAGRAPPVGSQPGKAQPPAAKPAKPRSTTGLIVLDPGSDGAAPAPAGLPVAHAIPAPSHALPDFETEKPLNPLQYLPGIFGLPIELNDMRTEHRPAMTWLLSFIMGGLLLLLMANGTLEQVVKEWGLIPAQPWRHGGLTFLTSFLLHAGLLHVASNLYFFVVFGSSVEDRLGKLWFLALLVAAHLAGVSLHMAADPRGAEPIVGASAGISGVIACYAVAFPQAKLGFFFLVRFIAVRAIWALVLFIVLQMFGAMEQLKGYSQVSYLAHLGGLAVGVVAGLIWRMRSGR